MVEINGERLIADLRRLAEIGRYRTGVDRIAFSEPDVAARRWLGERLAEIGLDVRTDRYGDVYGAWPGVERAVLIGSHTDTVPRGGWLDGAMGVVYALETARAFREAGRDLAVGIDVVSFQDEEGTYLPCLGSKAFCSTLSEAELSQARRGDGEPLTVAIERAAFSGEPLRADPGRLVGFLEAHIEQGPRLIASGTKIGVVTSFAGIRRMTIRAEGRADHAGTTPMDMRRDAAGPLFRFATWLQTAMPGLGGPETVWNIGSFKLHPGAANVVPSLAEMSFEFRDSQLATLERIERAVQKQASDLRRDCGLPVGIEVTARIPPSNTDRRLADGLADAARDLGCEPMLLQSGAGHDCMIVGKTIPAAMFFVPSIGGRSHDIDEDTAEEDIVFGCRVLARAVERLVAA